MEVKDLSSKEDKFVGVMSKTKYFPIVLLRKLEIDTGFGTALQYNSRKDLDNENKVKDNKCIIHSLRSLSTKYEEDDKTRPVESIYKSVYTNTREGKVIIPSSSIRSKVHHDVFNLNIKLEENSTNYLLSHHQERNQRKVGWNQVKQEKREEGAQEISSEISTTTRNESLTNWQYSQSNCEEDEMCFSESDDVTQDSLSVSLSNRNKAVVLKRNVTRRRALSRPKPNPADRTLFTCPECDRSFPLKLSLRNHLQIHRHSKPFKCNLCDKSYAWRGSLLLHQQGHSRYKCELCEERFPTKEEVVKHLPSHPRETSCTCDICKIDFPKLSNLRRHMKEHIIDKPFLCNHCNRSFSSKASLRDHMNLHIAPNSYQCPYCGKTCTFIQNLKSHLKYHTHRKRLQCDICQKWFSTRSILIEHLQRHEDGDEYICDFCGFIFKSKKSLKCHISIHTQIRPYACEFCGATFRLKSTLREHYKRHTLESPFQCSRCGKTFRQKSGLTVHMRIHLGIKPFLCGDCGQGFIQRGGLDAHMRRHLKN